MYYVRMYSHTQQKPMHNNMWTIHYNIYTSMYTTVQIYTPHSSVGDINVYLPVQKLAVIEGN